MNAAEMETKDTAVRIIREELTGRGIEIKLLFLFGSRARGEARPDSDWDFLVIVDRDMPRAEKRALIVNILRKMAELFIDAEIIIKSETQFAADCDDKGKVTYYAFHEGVLV